MLIHHRSWKQIVNTKTKPLTGLSVIRWTLIQHLTRSIDFIDDFNSKKYLLREEMIWLNKYWAQPVPINDIPVKYWERLILIKSLNIRRDLYEYLFDDERRQDKYKIKLKIQKEKFIEDKSKSIDSLWSKTIYGSIASKFNHKRWIDHCLLFQSARLNDFFIVDGGFEFAHIRHSYLSSLIQRVFRCFKEFHRFHSPSYIIITDLKHKFINNQIKQHQQSNYFHSTENLYIDLFDKDRLIYLTPDSENEMTQFEHDAIYILGGIYDDQNKQSLTYDKARRQNIRHLRLPIDKYLIFHPTSSKALAFHEVYNIVQCLKHTNNDWQQAFRYVPDRKIARRIYQ